MSSTLLKLPQGTYRGLVVDDIITHRAIPYAQPFERFAKPLPIEKHGDENVVHDGEHHGPISPQTPTRLAPVTGLNPEGTAEMSESHCGVLSIARPDTSAQNVPVIAFYHGGGFASGGGEIPWYDGHRFARDGGVIVVSVTHRLGLWGYLHTSNQELPLALQDIELSLLWIQKNIRHVGGDPSNVTVMGQSAGAFAIQILLEKRPHLFNRAILHSSPAYLNRTAEDGVAFRDALEVELAKSSGKTLATASVDELLALSAKAATLTPEPTVIPLEPVVLRPSGPRLYTKGRDILVGYTHDDGIVFESMYGKVYPDLYQQAVKDGKVSQVFTEKIFKGPSLQLAQQLQEAGNQVHTFDIQFQPKDFALGACHCVDLPLFFGSQEAWKDAPMIGNTPWDEWEEKGLSVRNSWAQFARDGTVPQSLPWLEVKSVS